MSVKTGFLNMAEFRAELPFNASRQKAGCYSGFEFGSFCKGFPLICKGIARVFGASGQKASSANGFTAKDDAKNAGHEGMVN